MAANGICVRRETGVRISPTTMQATSAPAATPKPNTVGGTHRVRLRRRSRRAGRLHRRWTDPHARLAPHAYAICGHRLCLRRIDDAGRLPFQNDERPRGISRWLTADVATD